MRCPECGFEFPTDWWASCSRGVSHATAIAANARGELTQGRKDLLRIEARRHDKLMENDPYYRHGFLNPVADAWTERDKIDWERVINAGDMVNEGRS